MAKRSKLEKFRYCKPVSLPPQMEVAAAMHAIEVNPANRPDLESMRGAFAATMVALAGPTDLTDAVPIDLDPDAEEPTPAHLAVTRWWPAGKVDLPVWFMEQTPTDLKDKIILYLNIWGPKGVDLLPERNGRPVANVNFAWTSRQNDARIRCTLQGREYYAYLGPDVDMVPKSRPNLSLGGFTMRTPEAEYMRVVPHEGFHLAGAPHEQQRRAIVRRLDVQKTIAWGRKELGWSEQMVRSQILTPLEETGSFRGTPEADDTSIMCYSLPASITVDGRPIPGGLRLSKLDMEFAGQIYPPPDQPPPPPPPGKKRLVIEGAYTFREEAVPAATTKRRRKLVA